MLTIKLKNQTHPKLGFSSSFSFLFFFLFFVYLVFLPLQLNLDKNYLMQSFLHVILISNSEL